MRECDVFILQSGCGVVNDVCMETFILAQAARTASSHRAWSRGRSRSGPEPPISLPFAVLISFSSPPPGVVAVLPYFPYSKQSKQKHRGCIPARLIADLLKVRRQ